jgi:trk/ktr system potassium uptake protein
MNLSLIAKLISLFLAIYSVSLMPVWFVSLYYQDHSSLIWFLMIFFSLIISGFLYAKNKTVPTTIQAKASFLLVAISWVTFGLVNSLPFIFINDLSFVAAFFESVSGLTTTGATVFVEIDELPKSILYFRQQLQWLGGMGIIVLMVAIIPMLNIGGMMLFKAETPGPMKDDKMTPRILHTAQYLWAIYTAATALCALAFWWAGMSLFDAIGHAMSTLSTGGFSTHTASLGFFNSPTIENIASFFMLLGALNFSLHFAFIRGLDVRQYIHDEEFQMFIVIILLLSTFIAGALYFGGVYDNLLTAIRYAFFEVVSIISSTGFGIADFSSWPYYAPALLMLSAYIGGCAGSTAGGMKIIRISVIFKVMARQFKLLLHPNGNFRVSFKGQQVTENTVQSIFAFLFFYVLIALAFILALLATGVDYLTAFGAVSACINVMGPGLGEVTSSFQSITPAGKFLLTILMIIGRLEVFTILVLLAPSYWKEIKLS